ncbi:MAG: Crp/Fnr family transcriptional regulator [Bacteroidia bacterium]
MRKLKSVGIIDLVNEKSFHSYTKGELILEQGKKTDFILYIETGKAKIVHRNSKGQEFIILNVKEGDYLGIHSLLRNENSFVSVTATETISGYKISEKTLSTLMENNSEVARDIISHLSARIGLIEEKISKMTEKKIKENVIKTLLQNIKKLNQVNSYSIEDIANVVGTRRNYIYAILREFEKMHLLVIKNKKVTIIDELKLVQFVSNIFNI